MTTPTIDLGRLERIKALGRGQHKPPNGEFSACVMEAVAYVAGEPWSDHPECACPVIGTFLRTWNDSLPDDDRTALLLPLIPRLVGTRLTRATEVRRATMSADWLVREYTPAWLRLAGLISQADALAALPEIADFTDTPSLMPALIAARDSAAAAWAAAVGAAWDAAGAAAVGAAWDALAGTARALQQSALRLVNRMIEAA